MGRLLSLRFIFDGSRIASTGMLVALRQAQCRHFDWLSAGTSTGSVQALRLARCRQATGLNCLIRVPFCPEKDTQFEFVRSSPWLWPAIGCGGWNWRGGLLIVHFFSCGADSAGGARRLKGGMFLLLRSFDPRDIGLFCWKKVLPSIQGSSG
jgi:hypothetical protein